jgi:hypothetical protein
VIDWLPGDEVTLGAVQLGSRLKFLMDVEPPEMVKLGSV